LVKLNAIDDSNTFSSVMRITAVCIFVILALSTLNPCVWGQDTQVTATVDSDTVGVQDQFQLTITVSGKDSGDAENPLLGRLQGFRIVSGPSTSTQFQWINGRSSSSKSFIYVLIPEKEGQFIIEPVQVRVGNKTYKTQQLQIRVTSAPSQSPAHPQRRFNPLDPFEDESTLSRTLPGDAVFVKAELDRDSAYAGQQVTLLYKIYTQVRITGIQLQESPSLSGFWVEDLEVEKNPKGSLEIIDGREYQVFTIKKQALFPTASGRLRIPPSIFAVSASSAGDFFGVFGRAETLYRKTQELVLSVKSLPVIGRPADFSNAVGTFKLTADMDKTQVATGEAVALRVKLTGQGNLKIIPDISIPAFPDFTIYSSKREDTNRTFAKNQIGGDKTWEYVIVPKAPGRQTIPSITFSFFNPDQEKYETAATPALSLSVVRSGDSTASISELSGSDKQNLTRQGTDVNFIKLSPGSLERSGAPLNRNFWFYMLVAFPLAFNAGAFLYQRRRSRLADNLDLIRNRRARRNSLARLRAAEKAGKSDPRRFYDRAASALSGYLADRFNLTEIELTSDTLERTLADRSIPHEIVQEVKACLQECDFGRFVSASDSAEKMSALSARVRRSIEELEKTTGASNVRQSQRALFNS
jgi:hypothetical protein